VATSLEPAEKRIFPRVRPRSIVSAAMYQGALIPPAYGIVSDISENGACFHSDRVLARGQRLQFRIQFAAQPELFEAHGRVRWLRPALREENGVRGGALTGVEFFLPSPFAMEQLRRLLVTADFEAPEGGSPQFEEFLETLRPFLTRLGALLDEVSRSASRKTPESRRR
jgi:PilZ domain